ncbi:unnamed protein product [Plutella xylostella]|uniref:(diamondback moth) hypothetical protein n=1 Tax=Plutella xylostella TaxID=51655 RepID=A0A8S4DPH2_PLUXY|nr:unnamed protein product [Plutella xylostella]
MEVSPVLQVQWCGDIDAGDSLVALIMPLARSTSRAGVLGGLGGFGGCFQLKAIEQEYKDPVLVFASDGVGTKLKIAQKIDQHGTIGIDLVAMCVNDVLCSGAAPLTFLDYFACSSLDVAVARSVVSGIAEGCRQASAALVDIPSFTHSHLMSERLYVDYFAYSSLDVAVARSVVSGIAEGCRQASAALVGGETAEMPGMYETGVYDIAGFSLGVVERANILPKINDIAVGDIIIGLPSNGVHSNGFSLIHKLVKKAGLTLQDKAPFSKEGLTLGEELIKPTRIYVRSVLPALQRGKVKAVAHITGGGLLHNIPRVIPEGVRARLNAHCWNVHPVFAWIADAASVSDEEMLRTFNCGIGMVLIVSPENQAEVMNITRAFGAMVIGSMQARPAGTPRVVVDNFPSALDFTRRMPLLPHKKVGVLVSGTGSNLQALIDNCADPTACMCADISLVISNKPQVLALQRAKDAGIPAVYLNPKDYATREEFDAAVSAQLEEHKIDVVCLAGYMRILSPEFVRKWKGRLINIHPSLLPRHPGLNAQKQCIDAGDRESGCTVHFVDEGVDTGAIILQERVPVHRHDTVETLTQRIHQSEHRAFPRALRLLTTGRVRLSSQGTIMWYS